MQHFDAGNYLLINIHTSVYSFYVQLLQESCKLIHVTVVQCVIKAATILGYSSMKPEQVEVAVALIEGRDVFAILPTGFGKSLCYACLPVAFDKCQKKERGYSIVVVVSPLVAIMKGQVRSGNVYFMYKTFIHCLHFKTGFYLFH